MPSHTRKSLVEHVFLKSRASLHNYLHRHVGSREESADLLHECFVRLAGAINPLRGEDDTRAYLFTIARNLVTDRFRKHAGLERFIQSADDHPEALSDAPCPLESLELERTRNRLRKTILAMPESTRRIFTLSRYEDLTYTEIAQRLAISTRTVERKMREALEVIRRSLDEEERHG